MANKCPKTLGNTGLSGIYAILKIATVTLLQLAMLKAQKRIVARGLQVNNETKRGITYEVSELRSRSKR
jgi:hypothetical protein